MSNNQYTIPAEVLTATVKVLGNYQSRLEKEARILAEDPDTQSRVDGHRKLIEIVRRLLAFYARLSPAECRPPCGGTDGNGESGTSSEHSL